MIEEAINESRAILLFAFPSSSFSSSSSSASSSYFPSFSLQDPSKILDHEKKDER